METKKIISSPRQGGDSRLTGRQVHLIGAGGSGMRSLAAVLLDSGARVSGSDLSGHDMEGLTGRGLALSIGQRAENIPADCELVVHTAAIKAENPELQEARKRGLEILKYSQMLGRLMSQKVGVAVSGTHGKSTTTAMVSYVLTKAGAQPTYVVGASINQLGGSSGSGEGKHFVVEACEYDRSFLNFKPQYAAILNIEEDHLDYYPDLDAIVEAFATFAAGVQADGVVVANGEDSRVARAVAGVRCAVETFGLAEGCTWRGTNLIEDHGLVRMDITYKGQEFCRLSVPLPGLHNAYNSLAATALLHHAGLDGATIAEHLATFTGTGRRMTLRAQRNGITVLDDYAHHPTEIQATLKAIAGRYKPQRLICVFQPHQHSRTRFLLKDFARSFGLCQEVIVPDIYYVRETSKEKQCVTSEDLVAQIRMNGANATYIKTFAEIVQYLQNQLRPGDLVVTMGAGTIWEVADEIVRWLGPDCKN